MVRDGDGAPAVPAGKAGGPHGRSALSLPAIAGNIEYDRVLFFSDAVFAIAITLLVVDLRVPNLPAGLIHAGDQLRAAESRILGFALSFAVIGLFWISHHTIFRHITVLNRVLIVINLLFLGMIAFLPYPTALLSATSTSQPPAVIFYAACVAAAGFAQAAIWLYAIRAGLVEGGITPTLRRYFTARLLCTPVVFALSIPVAAAAPSVAAYLWLLIVAINVVLRRTLLRRESLREEAGADS
jgi:TMEM175 potassium channel family protein